MNYNSALIVGAGSGLSASLARHFTKTGMKVALAARSPDKLAALAQETGARLCSCDATRREQVDKLFADLDGAAVTPDVVVYNASYRTRGPLVELEPSEVEKVDPGLGICGVFGRSGRRQSACCRASTVRFCSPGRPQV